MQHGAGEAFRIAWHSPTHVWEARLNLSQQEPKPPGWCKKARKTKLYTYKRGDKHDSCVICMSDYKEGDLLKILSCSHAYHCSCIDTWLVRVALTPTVDGAASQVPNCIWGYRAGNAHKTNISI
uniref:RING-type domain-containing protein n=1 Tax=Anas platyrhynchos platyrhynchos TaxID=8840 RepID=A0A493TV35_ANAPP